MAELEEMGLLYSPHVSSGRLPTERGLRLYVNNLLGVEIKINDDEENLIKALQKLYLVKSKHDNLFKSAHSHNKKDIKIRKFLNE